MTNPTVDVAALAKLARLSVSPEELEKLSREIPGILDFVATVQAVSTDSAREETAVRNVMRDDANPHESGIYTEALLSAAPRREKDYVAVKQVISRKK